MLLENLAQQMQLEFKDHVVSVVIDVDEAPSDAIKAISAQWRAASKQIASVTFARRDQFPMIQVADLCAGADRKFWIAGGNQTFRPFNRLHSSLAKRHLSSHWPIEQRRRLEEILRKRRARDEEG
jgi:hypothetical protein